uniref:Ig-like domain-containing protein n=1 Tax=Astatotilapia calliptera TaxID=8154 RepID=A0AAX7VHM3_ASTCA
MGFSSSKPAAPSLLLEKPWRKINNGRENPTDQHFVENYKPEVEEQNLRILLHGPVGAGKSSFINSVNSVLQKRVCCKALVANSCDCFTKKYTTYKIKKGNAFYPFVLNDMVGLKFTTSRRNRRIHVKDVKQALKGHIKDGYVFNPENKLSKGDRYYNRTPTENDKVHVLVCVVDANTASLMNDATAEAIQDIRDEATELDQKIITAESGQDVTLTCRAPNNTIIAVEWSRADLEVQYVLLYRDGHFNSHNQHPSFKNRVDLQDRQMKDGDVSLILKDVTINDTGTYECRVKTGNNRRKRANLSGDPISIIHLHVDPPAQTGGDTEDGGKEAGGKEAGGENSGSVGLIIGLSIVAVVGYLIYRKYKQRSQDSFCPTTEPQIEMSEIFLNSESPADKQRDRNDLKIDSSHQHSTRIPDVTLTVENELLHPPPPQQTAGQLPE